MKTTMITKAMMAVLFAMTSVLTLNAVEPVKITNEEVENGRVSAKVVYCLLYTSEPRGYHGW